MAPKAEVLQQLAEQDLPGRDPDPLHRRGQGDRGRLAVKLGSGLITDAVDVQAGRAR